MHVDGFLKGWLVLQTAITMSFCSVTFSSLTPSLVSRLGGNVITITGSNYPSLTVGTSIYCLWQSSYIVTGVYTSSSSVSCPVPSIFRFTAFSSSSLLTLNDLKVSFDTTNKPTYIVISPTPGPSQPSLPISFRSLQDELALFTVFPRQTFASFSQSIITITSSSTFPTGQDPSLPKCRFTITDSYGNYESSLMVVANVTTSSLLTCVAPSLFAIDANAASPSNAVIQLTFDGGQTFSHFQAGFRYNADFIVSQIQPTSMLTMGGPTVTLTGTGFYNSANLQCRFTSITPGNNFVFFASATIYVSTTEVLCNIPLFDPPIDAGTFDLDVTADGTHWISTGQQIVFQISPDAGSATPTTGYYYGGTLVNITGTSFTNSTNTRCVFGLAMTLMSAYISPELIQCRAPPCTEAKGFTGIPQDCTGSVTLAVLSGSSSSGGAVAGGLSFNYVAQQMVYTFSPWGGSSWDMPFPVRIYGIGFFSLPVYCQWLDLAPVAATAVGTVPPNEVTVNINSWVDCVAPILPDSYKPSAASGYDFVLATVEVSCNGFDFTFDKRQWFYYAPAEIYAVIPPQVYQGTTRPGGFLIQGAHLRSVDPTAISCIWYYDLDNSPTVFEQVTASFIDRVTLNCIPSTPVGISTTRVQIQLQMTPGVVSSSSFVLPAVAQPQFTAISVTTGPYLGGQILEVTGIDIFPPDEAAFYIVVGDTPVAATSVSPPVTAPTGTQIARITTPPIPHWNTAPYSVGIAFTITPDDRLGLGLFNYQYSQVPAGYWYHPALHKGTPLICDAGFYCGGGYPSNDTLSLTSVLLETPCPGGTYQSVQGTSVCVVCPAPAYCPTLGGPSPSTCPEGKVCWGAPGGHDNSVSYCPIGKLCVRPYWLAREPEIPIANNPFGGLNPRVLRQLENADPDTESSTMGLNEDSSALMMQKLRSLLDSSSSRSSAVAPRWATRSLLWTQVYDKYYARSLSYLPDNLGSNVTLIDCTAGRFCPPGSIALLNADNVSVSIETNVPYCSFGNVLCGSGSASPVAIDASANSGFYINYAGSDVIQCPPGYFCENGEVHPCMAGTYQDTDSSSSCLPCTAGTVCKTDQDPTLPFLCPPGMVCTLPGQYRPTYMCPAGAYCLANTITLNSVATDLNAEYLPQICSAGTYCLPGTNWPIPDSSNPFSPRPCAVGFYCGTNETNYQGKGACPLGYYCIAGSSTPVPAAPGYYVSFEGAYSPTKCSPGYYQDEYAQSSCKLCPDGNQCPLDGLSAPAICPAGQYRSNTDPFYQVFTDNIVCHPCPEGTWSWQKGLTSSDLCETCPERYVCDQQGMTVFATVEQTDCSPNENGVSICYALSQGKDCPEGYACDAGTTSFTQYNYPCEPGYFCKSLTALREMRNLLCPPGFYCKEATGYSKAYSLACPDGSFCPEGTAEVFFPPTSTNSLLYNVQSYYLNEDGVFATDVHQTNATTGASCIRCDPNVFDPPLNVDLSLCLPCGIAATSVATELWPTKFISPALSLLSSISYGIPTTGWPYLPVTAWADLICPDGTTSARGSSAPDQCLQQGYILAMVNIYNRTVTVLNLRAKEETALWRTDFEIAWITPGTTAYEEKISLQFGQPVSSSNSYIVDFLGFDPRIESMGGGMPVASSGGSGSGSVTQPWNFVSIRFDSLDIMDLKIDFSKVPLDTIMTTQANTGGHYKLLITSDVISSDGTIRTAASAAGFVGYQLPVTLSTGDGNIHDEFHLKMTALMDNINVNVSLALLNGNHYESMHYFNDALTISVRSPNKTDSGRQNSFYALVDSQLLNSGSYELPYNLVPTIANQPGDLSLVLDLANQQNYTIDTSLITVMVPGSTFWQVTTAQTLQMPWFPFFSNCDYFDRHIVIWDLLEHGDEIPSNYGQCGLYPESEVRVVAPLVYDFSNNQMQFEPVADWCEIALTCRYEDNMAFDSNSQSTPWMSIPGATTLFYLTQDPMDFAKAASPDFVSTIGKLDSLLGTDALIPVTYTPQSRTGNFPRLINLSIQYAQLTTKSKRIVSASVSLSNFDNDQTRTDYLLQISWEPMNWIALVDSFVLPIYVYAILYVMVGFSLIGFAIFAWGLLVIALKARRIPKFNLVDNFNFFLYYCLQGIVVGSIPTMSTAGLIKLIMDPSIDPWRDVHCAWPIGSTSTAAVILPNTTDPTTCRSIRTGTCLIIAGLYLVWSASAYFSPRLPESHKEYLQKASGSKLQDDGIYYPATRKKFFPETINTVLKWKRVHSFLATFLICLPLMVLFSVSYTGLFGAFTNYYTIAYMLTMLLCDLLTIKVTREKSTFNVVSVVIDVVYFVATLSAVDLNAFIMSYLFQCFFIVAQRLVAEKVLAYMYQSAIPRFSRWIRSRTVTWTIMLSLRDFGHIINRRRKEHLVGASNRSVVEDDAHAAKQPVHALEYSKNKKEIKTLPADASAPALALMQSREIIELDESADQVMGVAGRTISLLIAPYALSIVAAFPTETQFLKNYSIRTAQLPYYLLFAVVMIPFQIALDVIMNHAHDTAIGYRIYDYVSLCTWRWKNRLTRWLLDDARLDSSFSQSTQAIHHLAFSPQFYFIVTYSVYGGIFITYGITCWIVYGVPAFLDPAFGYYILIMFLVTRLADAIARWLVFYAVWKTADKAPDRAFIQSIALGLKQKELEEHQIAFRNNFFQRHREWLIDNLGKVYTPRGLEKYRSQISDIYQRVLTMKIPYLYTAPQEKDHLAPIEKPSDDTADDLAKKRFTAPEDMYDIPLHGGRRGDDDILASASDYMGGMGEQSAIHANTRHAQIASTLAKSWLAVARKTVSTSTGPRKSVEVFPDWVVVNMPERSKAILQRWIAKAREFRQQQEQEVNSQLETNQF